MKSRALCGWILCLALLKLYVNLQVTRLLNKSLDVVSMSSSRLRYFSWCLSAEASLSFSPASIWRKDNLYFFKCSVQQLTVIFSFYLVSSTPMQISMMMSVPSTPSLPRVALIECGRQMRGRMWWTPPTLMRQISAMGWHFEIVLVNDSVSSHLYQSFLGKVPVMMEGIKMASKAVEMGATGLGCKATPLKCALLPYPKSQRRLFIRVQLSFEDGSSSPWD